MRDTIPPPLQQGAVLAFNKSQWQRYTGQFEAYGGQSFGSANEIGVGLAGGYPFKRIQYPTGVSMGAGEFPLLEQSGSISGVAYTTEGPSSTTILEGVTWEEDAHDRRDIPQHDWSIYVTWQDYKDAHGGILPVDFNKYLSPAHYQRGEMIGRFQKVGVSAPAQTTPPFVPTPTPQPAGNTNMPLDLGSLITDLGTAYINTKYAPVQQQPVYNVPDAIGDAYDWLTETPAPIVQGGCNHKNPCPTGCVKKRRRRKRLASVSDIKDLAALKSVLGNGEAFKTWIATHSR